MATGLNQQRLDKLDIISENVRDAIEVAREGDNERDTQIRLFLALAIREIDLLRSEQYEDYIWYKPHTCIQAQSYKMVYILS